MPKLTDLTAKSDQELRAELHQLTLDRTKARHQLKVRQLTNTTLVRNIGHTIAHIKTELNNRALKATRL